MAFGLIHDSCRENNENDPEHGPRAAQWLRSQREIHMLLGSHRTRKIAHACEIHTHTSATEDPFDGVCLDADRTTLHRVGKFPDQKFFSTEPGQAYARTEKTILLHAGPGFAKVFHGSYNIQNGETPQASKATGGLLYTALTASSAEFYGPVTPLFTSFSKLADLSDPYHPSLLKGPLFKNLKEYEKDEFHGQFDGDGEPLDIFSLLEAGDIYHRINRSGQENFLRQVLSWGFDAVLFNDNSHCIHPTLVLKDTCIIQKYLL